jgi:hypothetical protein
MLIQQHHYMTLVLLLWCATSTMGPSVFHRIQIHTNVLYTPISFLTTYRTTSDLMNLFTKTNSHQYVIHNFWPPIELQVTLRLSSARQIHTNMLHIPISFLTTYRSTSDLTPVFSKTNSHQYVIHSHIIADHLSNYKWPYASLQQDRPNSLHYIQFQTFSSAKSQSTWSVHGWHVKR